MFKPALPFLLFGFLASSHAAAESRIQTTPPFADIRAQQLEIRERVMAKSGQYKDMSPGTRNELVARQDQLLALIEGKDKLDDLSEADKTLAFNTLEWINATITDSENNRMICERARPVGSNRVQRVCATVAERRANREAALRAIGDRPLCPGTCDIPSR